jgi:tRNA G10  N-methylase Trm11
MKNDKTLAPAVKYFFKHLERRSEQIKSGISEVSSLHKDIPFEEVEGFFRQIMTQNIFIHTVGLNGKHESTILAKAIFSMDKVVRVYYSTSFDEDNIGFIRVRPDSEEQLIIVERVHGLRVTSERIYVSRDQCHVVRFMVRWLMRRIDWDKTKLNNLELYKRVVAQEQEELKRQIEEQIAQKEAEELQRALEKFNQKKSRGVYSR